MSLRSPKFTWKPAAWGWPIAHQTYVLQFLAMACDHQFTRVLSLHRFSGVIFECMNCDLFFRPVWQGTGDCGHRAVAETFVNVKGRSLWKTECQTCKQVVRPKWLLVRAGKTGQEGCTHKGVEHDRKFHGRGPYTKISCALCDAVLMPELLEPALEPDLSR